MRYLAIIVSCLLTGCVSYQVSNIDASRPAHNRLKKTEHKGLVIAAEDYSSMQKSQKYFSQDLVSMGYLPILVCISNTGEDTFLLRSNEVLFGYEDGTQALLADVGDVVEVAKYSRARAILSIPLIFPVPFIWSSISEANQSLEEDYRQKVLHNLEIAKGDRIFGFIFIEIPEGKEQDSIGEGVLEMAVVKKGGKGTLAEMLMFSVAVSNE